MKIYSRKGDKGDTSLFNGKIVKKHNLRVDAYGTIDELNSFIGLLKDYIEDEKIKDLLNTIQIKLFSIGSFLSAISKEGELSNKVKIENIDIENIESEIDNFNKDLPKLKNFIIPGGHKPSSYSHVCRSICRRAERKISEINDESKINPLILPYVNRLSDLFFVLSRYLSFNDNANESYW
tara:strand:+ start:12467 stop:13006 length:540 start_codon:yes stop_codon:yes gene_type:complete